MSDTRTFASSLTMPAQIVLLLIIIFPLMAEVYISLPQGVTLYSVSRAEASVSLSGSAEDEASLFEYAWALKEGGRFGTVLVNSIAMGDGSLSWTIVLTGTTTAS